MGQDKADVLVGEHTMLDRVGSALREVTHQTVLLGPSRRGWESWSDTVHAHGPLAGIATALSRSGDSSVLAVAVDHPFVKVETLKRFLPLDDGVPIVPVDQHGNRQVTCALYPSNIADAAIEEASAGGSIQSLLDRVSFQPVTPETWMGWGEDGRSWFSVDDAETLQLGLALYS